MPRIYKGTETILKLYVHQCEVGDINTLRIALFTDTVDNSVEFYSDNMTIDGDTVFLRVNAWSFDMMNDGVINYIAHIESGEETFITERQSNYFLKTPTAYEPTITPNMDNYYTKGEVDELLENVEGGESDVTKEYVDKQDADLWKRLKLTEDKYIGVRSGDSSYGGAIKEGNIVFNFATINGESILGTKDILIQGGSTDPDSYIIYLPEDYSEETYTFDGEFVNSEHHGYWGSDRMEHNAQVIQAINEGKAKSVYLQRIREYFQVEDYDSGTYTMTPIFMYVPMQFRQKNEIVDGYTRIFGYYALSEDDNNQIYLVGYNFNDDGSADISIDKSYELEQSGGSGGGDYPSNPTFNSMTVYNESRFGQDTDIDGDVSYYIAANIKSPRASIRRLWTENIHLGYDISGEIGMLKFVHPFYSGSGNVNGEEVNDVYAMIDNQGNIYEGETKLSDKYALKSEIGGGGGGADLSNYYTKEEIDSTIGDINNILSSI
jgi:hypothetical protein